MRMLALLLSLDSTDSKNGIRDFFAPSPQTAGKELTLQGDWKNADQLLNPPRPHLTWPGLCSPLLN
jgi:hypothetical protein